MILSNQKYLDKYLRFGPSALGPSKAGLYLNYYYSLIDAAMLEKKAPSNRVGLLTSGRISAFLLRFQPDSPQPRLDYRKGNHIVSFQGHPCQITIGDT